MSVHNADIAAIFEEIAELLEIENANPFRIRAYRNAAREVTGMSVELATRVARGEDLTELPAIGKDLAEKIKEIVQTGQCQALSKLRGELPASITALLKIPGLGPKRVRTLHDHLNIDSLEQLATAAAAGKIREVEGFGPKTEQMIRDALAAQVPQEKRFRLNLAAQYAEPLAAYLETIPGVDRVVIAGSYRRCKETVGDIDILVTAKGTKKIMDRLAAYEEVERVSAMGATRATVVLRSRLQVDVRVVEPVSYGAALCYFTGSKSHNIEIRKLAQGRKLKLSEYGVFKGEKRIAGDTEESVYNAVGLPWIPPELRESRGEIEAARAGKLPELASLEDLRGDLHVHTNATDGHATIETMAEAAQRAGLEYIAITDHSKKLTMAHGLDAKRLHKQIDAIDSLNDQLRGFTVLKGIEVDILDDGRLDLPDDVLARLDLVIGAVHSQFKLSRAKQTKRIVTAMDNRYFTILAHPSGRLIEQREPYDVDMEMILQHASQRGCFLEVNAQPDRLDLIDVHCQRAKQKGVRIAINSDAHSPQDFVNLKYGVFQARRGWLERKDVLNTLSLKQLRIQLKALR